MAIELAITDDTPQASCTVCGTPYEKHGTFPTCASHPYTPDGMCRAVQAWTGGQAVPCLPCAVGECNTKGCVRARPIQAAAADLMQPINTAPKTGSFLALDENGWEVWSAEAYWLAMASDAPVHMPCNEARALTHWHPLPEAKGKLHG